MRRRRPRILRGFLVFLGLLSVPATLAYIALRMDRRGAEVVLLTAPDLVARAAPFEIEVRAGESGLSDVRVVVHAAGATHELAHEEFPATGWRGSGERVTRLSLRPDPPGVQLPEGPARVEVFADTHGWRPFRSGSPRLAFDMTIDRVPPTVEVLSDQHHVRLGGSDLALWKVSEDAVSSWVQVGSYRFPGIHGLFAEAGVVAGLFAVPQDLDPSVEPRILAADAAGNVASAPLRVVVKPRRFSERTLPIDDAFLARKVPELERLNGLPPSSDPVEGYLRINRDLRRRNEAKIAAVTAVASPQLPPTRAFHRQSNAAPLSSFADRRTYTHREETIDRQVHLGFDLASLREAPVEATQDGVVVFAEDLGIYGRTVILDHGFGIFSLYGHLSQIDVAVGQTVRIREILGRTGETGLAGGDHLHFSILLAGGVHVDPIEWWDGHWIRDHVTRRLERFALAPPPTVAVEPAGSDGEPTGSTTPEAAGEEHTDG